MDKEDQIINQLEALERESKLTRNLMTLLLALVSLFMMLNVFSDWSSGPAKPRAHVSRGAALPFIPVVRW
jgi:hypothetical protein